MGHILGYPCADEFDETFNRGEETEYTFSVNAIIDYVQLIPNVCKSSKKRSQFENIAKDAKKVFESLGITFVKVLVNKLNTNETLLEEDIYELNEMLENFDFKDLLMKDFDVFFQK